MDSQTLFYLSLASCRLLAVIALATGALLLGGKAVRELAARYAGRRETFFLGTIVDFLMSPAGTQRPRLPRTRPFDSEILDRLLVNMSFSVSGPDFDRLCGLYEAEGFAVREAGRLRSSHRWWVRARAAQRLGQMKAASQKAALAAALQDREVEVRLMAAWALGRLGDLESLRPIFTSLAGFSKIAALRVSNIVLGFGDEAVPVVLELLATPDPVVQDLAIRMLGELRKPAAAKAVAAFTRHPEKELRVAACEALGRIGDAKGLKALRAALHDTEWPVVAKAVQSLGLVGDTQAIPEIVERLAHREWWVRLHAGEALARMGEPGKRALQSASLSHKDRFARDMAAQWLDEILQSAAAA